MGCVSSTKYIKVNDVKDNNNNEKIDLNNEEKINKIKSPKTKIDSGSNTKSGYLHSNNQNMMIYNESPLNISFKHLIKNASELDDKYYILEKLSKNPISTNYKIQSKENTKIFKNMKVISKSTISENNDEKKILQEIEILKNLKHENIIEVEECYGDEKCYYVITEYSEFGNLKDQFAIQKKYSENQTKFILLQLLKAIKYLNENNFIHTDIKPENVLISEKFISNNEEFFNVKLIDFGSVNSLINFDNQSLPYYIAPEVIDRQINAKCDIWSIGIIMFRLIFGNVPFKGNTFNEILNNIKNSTIEFYIDENNNISDKAENILSNMLIRDVNKRFDVNDCINHPFFKNDDNNCKNKSSFMKSFFNSRNNSFDYTIKTQYEELKKKNLLSTVIYKENNNINHNRKKLRTVIDNTNNNTLFISSLIFYIDYYNKINFNKNEEEQIINKLYQEHENRDLSEIEVSKIYDCTIEYTGVINYSVRYIAFKEKIKDDIKIYFKNVKYINFYTFRTFLIREKKFLIDSELNNNFEKLIKKNKEEIEKYLNIEYPNKQKYEKYINMLKQELVSNKIYSYHKFKTIIKKIIDKVNELNNISNNTFSNNIINKSNTNSNYNNSNYNTLNNINNNNKDINNHSYNNNIYLEKIYEKEEFEKINDIKKESKINASINHHLDGIVNITKKSNSKSDNQNYFLNEINGDKKASLKLNNSFDIPKKKDPNAFDPEKFLLLVDKNYLTKK